MKQFRREIQRGSKCENIFKNMLQFFTFRLATLKKDAVKQAFSYTTAGI